MFKRNEVWAGLIIGIVLPLAFYVLLSNVFNLLEEKGAVSGAGLSNNFRERTVALVAIAINVIPLQVYRRRRWEAAMRGIVVATGIFAIIWLVRFGMTMI